MIRFCVVASLLVGLGSSEVARAQVNFGGHVSAAVQLRLGGCGDPGRCRLLNFRNANVVGLTVDARPTPTTELVAGLRVRNVNFTTIETLDDQGQAGKVQPIDLRFDESRVTLFDLFGASGLDFSMGALRVAWGTSDGIAPTDVVNPLDLEEGAAFDRRLPSLAAQLVWSGSSVRVEVTALPLFLPSLLPVDEIDFTTLGDPQGVLDLTDGESDPPSINKVETPVDTPEAQLENVQVAARVTWASPVGDFAVVGYRGFESLPQASGEVRLTGFQTQNRIDLGVPLVFPRLTMFGAWWRGPVTDRMAAWAEVAVILPEAHSLTAARTQLEQLVKLGRLDEVPDPLPNQSTQSDSPYLKAVAGFDYAFDGDVYLNVQYARGLPTERQASDVHDYALLALRWSPLDGRLSLEARGALEIADGGDALGWQAGGRIAWLHGDAAEIALSASMMDGAEETTFSRFESLSHVRFETLLRF